MIIKCKPETPDKWCNRCARRSDGYDKVVWQLTGRDDKDCRFVPVEVSKMQLRGADVKST